MSLNFEDKSYYEAKVYLKAYADAINCLKEAAQHQQDIQNYEQKLDVLIQAKRTNGVEFKQGNVTLHRNFSSLKEVKLAQFTDNIFKNYFPTFDSFSGNYADFKNVLNTGLTNLSKDQSKI